MRNFQILTVFAVKICQQCLQTASAFGGLCPTDPPTEVSPLYPTGGLPSPDRLGYSDPNENFLHRHCTDFVVPCY